MADPSMAKSGWRVRVPASSANLGPGFDALGLALGIYLDCRFRPSEALQIRLAGRDTEGISTGEDNLIWSTAVQVAIDHGRSLAPIEIIVDNGIPLGKGLGSSAAALVTGVVIADCLLGLHWKAPRILDEAARIEGHPDNVAACVLGSIVATALDSGNVARAVRLEMHPSYQVAVVVPDFVLPTSKARSVLPDSYSKSDTIFNVQRASLLIAALTTGTTSAFPAALEDRMHQPYRCPLVPGLEQILHLRAPGLLGCALSGAGPSVLVFHETGQEDVCELVRQIFRHHGHGSEVMKAAICTQGYSIKEDHQPWT
ncbi:MAG: homoserine kinase [Bryobacteraceae bacterium]